MQHPGFFEKSGPFSSGQLADRLNADCDPASEVSIADIKTLQDAGPDDATFFNNRKYLPQLATTSAGVCLVAPAFADKVPSGTVALVVSDPHQAVAVLISMLYQNSHHPRVTEDMAGTNISPSARIEKDVIIEPTAVIGPEVEIGSGSRICAGSIIGYRCMVGRNCFIGPRVTWSIL